MKKRLVILAATLMVAGSAHAQQTGGNPYLQHVPLSAGPVVLPVTAATRGTRAYEMSRTISPKEKEAMMKQIMPMMGMVKGMDIKDVMNLMTIKYQAKPDLSFEDVKQSMELRANQLNFKKVGESPMWKDIQAVLGDMDAPRMEVYHYCDIAAGREILKYAPESIVYLPCRIAIMEDADKNIWVLTLDWNTAWLDSISGKMGAPDKLMEYAADIRDKMDVIMRAAAEGDL
jgi:uncharacterized protein (DUF302 family)